MVMKLMIKIATISDPEFLMHQMELREELRRDIEKSESIQKLKKNFPRKNQ